MKKIKINRLLIAIIGFIAFYIIYNPGKTMVSVEKLDIPSAVGYDIEKDSDGKPYYSIPISIYVFAGENKILSNVHIGASDTLCGTREERQMMSSGKFTLGLEKVLIFSEGYARDGIKNAVDILFTNPLINDTAQVGVFKGKSAEILSLKIEGYPTAADYISDQIKNIAYYNFFGDNYKLFDIYVRLDEEGRRVKLPYIELIGGKPKVTGVAVFGYDKMIRKLDLDQAKIMNFLSQNKVMGELDLYKSYYENICIYGKTQRRAECIKAGDKYYFTIDVTFKGEVVNNSLYKGLEKEPEMIDKFKRDLAEKMETESYEFINKMQNEYKMDLLGLGEIAAAKYGRGKSTQYWDEAVSNSDISVNVKIKVDKMGRGRY